MGVFKKDETLGELLYQARQMSGKTIRQISAETDIGIASLHALEHDTIKTPNPSHLALLSAALGLTIYDLYEAAGYAMPTELQYLGWNFINQMMALSPEGRYKAKDYVAALWHEEHPGHKWVFHGGKWDDHASHDEDYHEGRLEDIS